MRVWIFAAAVALLLSTASSAQDRAPTATQNETRAERRDPPSILTCINSEVLLSRGVTHYFRASGPATYVHVTTEGLRISPEARPGWGLDTEVSPANEMRWNAQITSLRAAAASNSRVRLRHNDLYYVTDIEIAYRQRCD